MMPSSKQSSANHFPDQIDASTMIVRSQRSGLRRGIDWVLTLLAWFLFLFLFIKGIWAVGTNQVNGIDMPFMSRALPSVDTLSIYALAMLLQALLLLVWALYNWTRFHGKTRRSSASSLGDDKLSRSYGINRNMLQSLQSSSISVIHHTPDGNISAITHPAGTALLTATAPNTRLA